MLKTKKQKTSKLSFQGKQNIEDLLRFEGNGVDTQFATNSTDDPLPSHSMSTKEVLERPSLLSKNCKLISPVEAFQALVNKHEKNDTQNIYFMCISFILQSEEEIEIDRNSSTKILTNYIFKEKPKRKNVKSTAKKAEEESSQQMTSQMKYFISSEFSIDSPIQIQSSQGLLTNILDSSLFLNIVNYSSEKIVIAPKTALGKIFFYFQ